MSNTPDDGKSPLPGISTRFADAVFCDDVRQEDNGKLLLIGVYNATLHVAQAPVFLPSLAILIRAKTPSSEPFEKFVVRIYLDDELLQELNVIENDADAQAALKSQADSAREGTVHQVVTATKMVPFAVAKAGLLRVRVDTGREILRAGALHIVVAEEGGDSEGERGEG